MPTILINNIDKEDAATASIDSIPGNADMALAAAAKNGNRKAFEILVERHEQRIFFVARRMTRTREDAEDVVQQSFQKAFTHRREWAEMLFLAMNELPPGIRRAIQLRELDERSSEETARIMGISVSALKGRMFHGRRKLRERLKHFVEPAWTSARKTSRMIRNTTHISEDQVACNACG